MIIDPRGTINALLVAVLVLTSLERINTPITIATKAK